MDWYKQHSGAASFNSGAVRAGQPFGLQSNPVDFNPTPFMLSGDK